MDDSIFILILYLIISFIIIFVGTFIGIKVLEFIERRRIKKDEKRF